VGTATFIHPEAMPKIIKGLAAFCEQRGIARITDLIGQVRDSDLSAEAVLLGYST
jgi:dihydroorotate dehydrogenase (NAD+) catalytic subunit